MPQSNYRKDSKKVMDYLLDGGVKGRIFVNISRGNEPYIITNIFPCQIPEIEIHDVSGHYSRCVNLLPPHLSDPEYDPEQINDNTANHWVVDRDIIAKELADMVLGTQEENEICMLVKSAMGFSRDS